MSKGARTTKLKEASTSNITMRGVDKQKNKSSITKNLMPMSSKTR
jgi:hypothetical protein